jgi:hypothetical protein
MAGKEITEQQAAQALKECGGSKPDKIDNNIAAVMIKQGVGYGDNGKKLADLARTSENVGSCVAQKFELEEPSALDKAKGWLTGVMNKAAEVQDAAAKAVADLAIKPGQGPTNVTIHNNIVKVPEQRI